MSGEEACSIAVRLVFWVALMLTGAAACSGTESSAPPPDTTAACGPGQAERDGGGCEPAGVPADLPCAPGRVADASGACVVAGVPSGRCGLGFTPDTAGGCAPVLPTMACGSGTMAVPGETQCHAVAVCGSGDWGSIPVDATTQYVDGSYGGMDCDGSSARPWNTIAEALAAAEPNAIIAIAAGTYQEDVQIADKPVRLWGRCPAKVEIKGTGAASGTIVVGSGADGTEIHDLAVTGTGIGIASSGSANVVLDHAWIHDTGQPGVLASDDIGATSVTLTRSLVESAQECAVHAKGADVTIAASVLRGAKQDASGQFGWGIDAADDASSLRRSTLTLKGSLVEANHEAGVAVAASDATIDATVVRSTDVDENGRLGDGITLSDGAKATITGCVADANHDTGISVNHAEATIEATVVRGTLPLPTHAFGWGLEAAGGASLTLRASLFDQNTEAGIVVTGSDATMEGVAVRNTRLLDGVAGFGLEVRPSLQPAKRATVSLSGCAVEQNHEIGVHVAGGDAIIETTSVRGTLANAAGSYGRGIDAEIDASSGEKTNLTLRSSLVENSGDTGVAVIGCDASVETSTIRTTHTDSAGNFGDGLAVVAQGGPATLTSSATLFESNDRAGLSSFGAAVTFGGNVFSCNLRDVEGDTANGTSFSFQDEGNNTCGCAATPGDCQATTGGIAAPAALTPIPRHD